MGRNHRFSYPPFSYSSPYPYGPLPTILFRLACSICSLDNPDTISIYPKDFDSKEEIISIIDKYNEGKKEVDKIKYTDIPNIIEKMMNI